LKKPVRISVIGSINRDTVVLPDGRIEHGYGGILYNVFGLSQLFRDRVAILPICNVGSDIEKDVRGLLSKPTNVDIGAISFVDYTNNHCKLRYLRDGTRSEIFTGFVPAINSEQMKSALDSDITLINFISGRDVTLRTLTTFRREYSGMVYIDFHTLSLGLHRDGTRFLRKPKRWMQYFNLCDFMQMNGDEFELLSGLKPDDKNVREFFIRLDSPEPRCLLVTLGSDGAIMAFRGKNGIETVHQTLHREHFKVTDTTGAGDLFTAGFIAGLALKMSLKRCLELAVSAGSEGCGFLHPQDVRFRKTRLL